ncbi:LysR family transcriptional regulator [Kordiimonas laminariae]|uniref:LysR family transcriptional regulator n=1 Tax=Kordiimonas laminariae TaxID=2917717 RepID=UPI001FF34750|nr:LysR family transcriptional regulator [Kordiimonas laminariae]MCK0070702.1 LysR family transcriptional regulator [Kordiimonas laminariae]
MSKLPPLDRLRATEAAARLKSFKLAAAEIGITPSAVSHRIRALEADMGAPLFIRHGSGVIPTETGTKLAQTISASLCAIERTWNELAYEAKEKPIKVSCAQTLSSHFLIPRLADHNKKHAGFNVEIITSNDFGLVEQGTADISLHIGTEPQTHLNTDKLSPIRFLLVSAKDRVSSHLKNGKLSGPLLAMKAQPDMWDLFTRYSKIEIAEGTKLLWFDAFQNVLTAIQNGLGATLIPEWLLPQISESYGVAAVSTQSIDANMAYWLISQPDPASTAEVNNIKSWVKTCVQENL